MPGSESGARDEDSDDEIRRTGVPTKDIDSWLDLLDDSVHIDNGTLDPNLAFEVAQSAEDPEILQDFKNYSTLIYETTAFTWFTDCLRRELYLCSADPDTMKGIRQSIVNSLLPPAEFSATQAAKEFQIRLEVDWDPTSFLPLQKYGEGDNVALDHVITLTESAAGPQATLCKEYLNKVWPSTGVLTLTTVQRHLYVKNDKSARGKYETLPRCQFVPNVG